MLVPVVMLMLILVMFCSWPGNRLNVAGVGVKRWMNVPAAQGQGFSLGLGDDRESQRCCRDVR